MENCTSDNLSNLQKTLKEADRGFVIESGINFEISCHGLGTLDARMVRGLSRLRECDVNSNIQNQSLTLILDYSFGL